MLWSTRCGPLGWFRAGAAGVGHWSMTEDHFEYIAVVCVSVYPWLCTLSLIVVLLQRIWDVWSWSMSCSSEG
eukprot:3161911-Amphidinium_carterae.1